LECLRQPLLACNGLEVTGWNTSRHPSTPQGSASGPDRAAAAALKAISSPLLDTGIDRATGVVWNISGPPGMTLAEVRCADLI
jgi:hypothetical protein